MTAHDPRVTLTEVERRSLVEPFQRWLMDPEGVELSGVMSGSVERIIAARLAPIRALAEEWESVAAELAPEDDRGESMEATLRADFLREKSAALRNALDAPQDAPRGPVGGEQGAEVADPAHDPHAALKRCHCGDAVPCRRHSPEGAGVPPGCYCDRSDHNKCPGGLLCCCSPDLARELAAKEDRR